MKPEPQALVVGINKFIYLPKYNLQGCVPDEQTMWNVMARVKELVSLGVPQENITILTDYAATKAQGMARLNQMVSMAQDGEAGPVYFSFSSHGTNGTGPGGQHEAMVWADIRLKGDDWDRDTLTIDDEFHALLYQMPPQERFEAWLDCCFAEGMMRELLNPGAPQFTNRFLPHPSGRSKEIPTLNMMGRSAVSTENVVWCACSKAQTSADAYIEGGYHGALTYCWDYAYRKNPNKSRADILALTKDSLAAAGYSQVPHLFCNSTLAARQVGQ
jgi:hypothetical protein